MNPTGLAGLAPFFQKEIEMENENEGRNENEADTKKPSRRTRRAVPHLLESLLWTFIGDSSRTGLGFAAVTDEEKAFAVICIWSVIASHDVMDDMLKTGALSLPEVLEAGEDNPPAAIGDVIDKSTTFLYVIAEGMSVDHERARVILRSAVDGLMQAKESRRPL